MNFKSHLLIPFLTFFLTTLTFSVSAQAPLQIPYQGVARDAQGVALQNQSITLFLAIEDITGAELFSETHSTTTNQFGLFNVKIGSVSNMPSNLWSNGDRFLHVKMDPTGGSVFTDLGTTQFLSVPYALYAETSNTPGPQGPAGLSAYEIWLSLGNEGNEQDFIASLTGPQGQCGNCDENEEEEGDNEEDQTNSGSTGLQGPIGPQGPQGTGIVNITNIGNSIVFTLSDGTTQSISLPQAPVRIGDYYQGGTVGYILKPGDPGYDSNVTHGLIYPKEWFYQNINGLYLQFGCEGIVIESYSGQIGSGQYNTNLIIQNCPELNTAANFCNEFETNGYSDWFLPSYDEIRKIMLNDYMLPDGGFINGMGNYWSSTTWPNDFNIAFCVETPITELYGANPNYTRYTFQRVVPIRVF